MRELHLELVSILDQVVDVHVAMLLCLRNVYAVVYKGALHDEELRPEDICVFRQVCKLDPRVSSECNLWLLQAAKHILWVPRVVSAAVPCTLHD